MNDLNKYFHTALEIPDGIKKLRELILTLAMQGKLVKQDEKDQPAGELLKEIEKEKRLTTKGTKNTKEELPPIKAEEVPYSLPKGWEWVRLGEILKKYGAGSTPLGGNKVYQKHGIIFLRSQNVWDDGLVLDDVARIDISIHEKMSGTKVLGNDILLNITGASIGRSTIYPVNFEEANVSQHVAILRLIDVRLASYLHKVITSKFFQDMIMERQVGVSREGLSMTKLKEFTIPLPPLNEQKRIVAKIDSLMALCDKLEKERNLRNEKRLTIHSAAINGLLSAPDEKSFSHSWKFITKHFDELYSVPQNVAELKKTILQLAVMGKLVPQDPKDEPASELLKEIEKEKKLTTKGTKNTKEELPPIKPEEVPYSLPKGWEWVRLGEILIFGPSNGFSPQAVNYETSVRSLTLSATTSGKFKEEHSKFIDSNIPEDSDLWLQDGDILIQRGNSIEYVGVSAIYRGKPNHFIYPDLMMKIRIASQIDSDYILTTMNTSVCRNYLRSRASGTSGSMPKINQTIVRSLPIPLPPLNEQKRIVAKIDELMALCDAMEKHIHSASNKQSEIFNAVLSKI